MCTEQQHFVCEDGMECTDMCTTGRPGLCYNGAECTERWLIEQQWLCNNDIKYAEGCIKRWPWLCCTGTECIDNGTAVPYVSGTLWNIDNWARWVKTGVI